MFDGARKMGHIGRACNVQLGCGGQGNELNKPQNSGASRHSRLSPCSFLHHHSRGAPDFWGFCMQVPAYVKKRVCQHLGIDESYKYEDICELIRQETGWPVSDKRRKRPRAIMRYFSEFVREESIEVSDPKNANPEPCCVYVLQSSGPGMHIKVGITRNLKQRISDLRTGSGADLAVLATINCDSWERARYIEKTMHEMLEKYHVGGEWFRKGSWSVLKRFVLPSQILQEEDD